MLFSDIFLKYGLDTQASQRVAQILETIRINMHYTQNKIIFEGSRQREELKRGKLLSGERAAHARSMFYLDAYLASLCARDLFALGKNPQKIYGIVAAAIWLAFKSDDDENCNIIKYLGELSQQGVAIDKKFIVACEIEILTATDYRLYGTLPFEKIYTSPDYELSRTPFLQEKLYLKRNKSPIKVFDACLADEESIEVALQYALTKYVTTKSHGFIPRSKAKLKLALEMKKHLPDDILKALALVPEDLSSGDLRQLVKKARIAYEATCYQANCVKFRNQSALYYLDYLRKDFPKTDEVDQLYRDAKDLLSMEAAALINYITKVRKEVPSDAMGRLKAVRKGRWSESLTETISDTAFSLESAEDEGLSLLVSCKDDYKSDPHDAVISAFLSALSHPSLKLNKITLKRVKQTHMDVGLVRLGAVMTR